MKVKIAFIVITTMLLLFSVAQIFSLPPYAGDIAAVYRSGYFVELDRQFMVVRDAFLGIKSMARAEYAWVFLADLERDHGIVATVFDARGRRISAPGQREEKPDDGVLRQIEGANGALQYRIAGGRYRVVMPLAAEPACLGCHRALGGRRYVGALVFERPYDALVYYSAERTVIFSVLSVLMGLFLFLLIRWEPGKNIKELFDKS